MEIINNNIINNNDKLINNIKTSMEMENQFLSPNDINVLRDFANNKISMEDAMNTFKKMTL